MKMNRKDVSFASKEAHHEEEKAYWLKASIEEKVEMITYLRECFMALKQLPEDFRGFLNFLNKNGVKYLKSKRSC